jgi:hypothetical protein
MPTLSEGVKIKCDNKSQASGYCSSRATENNHHSVGLLGYVSTMLN